MSWKKWDEAHRFGDPLSHKNATGDLTKTIRDHHSVELKDGTSIHHEPGGLSIKNRAHREVEFRAGKKDTKHSAEVAKRALDLSAQSKHPDSVGGVKSHRSFDAFKKDKTNAGKRGKTEANKYDPLHGKFGTRRSRR